MRIAHIVVAFALAASACGRMPASGPTTPVDRRSTPVDVTAEFERLRSELTREVPGAIIDAPDAERRWLALAERAVAAGPRSIDRAQLLIVVDRNPAVQQMRILLADPSGAWRSLGGSTVSTGQEGRHGYFITPTGVFLHTDAILDWRAEGTFNEHHIRGLGLKGMRVWDFGWQPAERGWGAGSEYGEIRLLMHATDPDVLEQRLGRPASKGCVRIPAAMNRFLDRHGMLDADYEMAAKQDSRFEALLLPDRVPTPLAGTVLVIVDSGEIPVARN